MLTVQHKWPSGSQFEFNCYIQWDTLVIREGNSTGHFLYSKEEVTQGYPLAIVVYVLGILPLIQELQMTHPIITQPGYVDDDGAGGNFK